MKFKGACFALLPVFVIAVFSIVFFSGCFTGPVDRKPECFEAADGMDCTVGIWYDEFGRVCGGTSCVGMGTGKCLEGKCVYTDQYPAELWARYESKLEPGVLDEAFCNSLECPNCEPSEEEELKKHCYFDLALATENERLCDESNDVEQCYYDLAMQTGQASFCGKAGKNESKCIALLTWDIEKCDDKYCRSEFLKQLEEATGITVIVGGGVGRFEIRMDERIKIEVKNNGDIDRFLCKPFFLPEEYFSGVRSDGMRETAWDEKEQPAMAFGISEPYEKLSTHSSQAFEWDPSIHETDVGFGYSYSFQDSTYRIKAFISDSPECQDINNFYSAQFALKWIK